MQAQEIQTGEAEHAYRHFANRQDKCIYSGYEFNSYPDMFETLLDGNPHHFFTTFDVTASILPDSPDICDGYIITGSSAGVYEDHIWLEPLFSFIRACSGQHLPMVGICFGHQAIAHALGGTVVKFHDGWGVGNRQMTCIMQTS